MILPYSTSDPTLKPKEIEELLRASHKGKKYKAKVKECDLDITNIFMKNKRCGAKIVVNRGGARSGKSYAIAQLLFERFFTLPRRKILILRKTLPSLRISTLDLMQNMLDKMELRPYVKEEKVALNFWFPTLKSLIHFGSLDEVEKVKSSEWNDIWMEEATEFSYEEFQILKTRLSFPINKGYRNQLFLSLNPINENHWIKRKIIDGPEEMEEIVSSYKDNPFLDVDYRKILDDLINQSWNHYRIYALGEWGELENIIYANWNTIKKMPDESEVDHFFYSVDFGFNAPNVLLHILTKEKDVYVEELIYKSGLTTQQFGELIYKVIPIYLRNRSRIYCDSSEPDRIEELKKMHLRAFPARKGQNSVKDGIDFIQTRKLHILESSANLIKELNGYCWKKDKAGNSIDEPVKYNDHALDSLRYGLWTHLGRGVGPKIWVVEVQ